MRRFIISILAVATCAGAAETMPAFPTVRVNNYTTLKTWFHDAPHTTATFEMTRTMPSGRQLKSRGSFEFRLGIGMMWRTEHPVRNAMVITSKELKIYDAKGESPYTTQELKIIGMIKENADKLKKENKEEYKSTIQKYKQELKEQNRINIPIKRQEKILAKYKVSVNEAKSIIDIPEKIDEYLIKASKLLSKIRC